MQRRGQEKQIFRNNILQMSICRDEEIKVKYTQMKYCRCQYAGMRKAN